MGEKLSRETGEKRYKEESAYFLNRAQDYVNLFDAKAGFFQGKDASGKWRVESEKYDPRVWGYDYTETNGSALRLHRPAGQPGPGQPLRRSLRPRRQAGRVPRHPGDSRAPASAPPAASSTR
ncbi:hypothetical protein SFUMM280S_02782 [Streptomyces fumanus]